MRVGIRMSTTIYYDTFGASHQVQLDENNNFIDPVTGELMHYMTVEEMPRHTFGAELYAPAKEQSFKIKPHCENCKYATKSAGQNAVSGDTEYYCNYMRMYHPPEFYCAAGELRTNNDTTD